MRSNGTILEFPLLVTGSGEDYNDYSRKFNMEVGDPVLELILGIMAVLLIVSLIKKAFRIAVSAAMLVMVLGFIRFVILA